MEQINKIYDVIIVGAGVSGSFIADQLTREGMKVLMLEAGPFLDKDSYPTYEVLTSSKMYWSGGIELNKNASLAFLRPKVVGGGSIVNQALLDRFDEEAFSDWRAKSSISYLNNKDMASWYEKAESKISVQTIPENARNKNAEIFIKGMEKNGFSAKALTRAQSGCEYEKGNDCIECLSGCRIDSKQSMPVTTLKSALSQGLKLIPLFEVKNIKMDKEGVEISGIRNKKDGQKYKAKKLVMAAGAIGNSLLLLRSGLDKSNPAVGENFYTHPQYMSLGVYKEPVNSFKSAFQSVKSDDPKFRKWGFKLENVFAPPAGLAMLVPGHGKNHVSDMKKIPHMACVEVAVRDTNPGKISIDSKGRTVIDKKLNSEDKKRRDKGVEIIHNIFSSTGAEKIIKGNTAIGLHLMGGCVLGTDGRRSVTNPEFNLHSNKNVFIADSSVFPSAPGINPSLTIMALSTMASQNILRGF